MPAPRRSRPPLTRLLSVLLALGLPTVSHAIPSNDGPPTATAPDPLDRIRHIPESNPYRAALAELLSMSDTDRERLDAWIDHRPANAQAEKDSPTAEQLALARRLANAVAQASHAPPTTPEDWPLAVDPDDPDNPAALISTETGPMRQLARITVKVAAESRPEQAIPLYAATARFGREARQGGTLIKQLTGSAIDNIALAAAAERLNEFSPADLEALSSAWSGLPPPASIHHALESEQTALFDPIYKNILLPGLHAYFASEQDPAREQSAAQPSFAHLRLSALVDFGDGEKQITLENRDTGESFTITQKRPAEGVELLGFDIPGQRATIRVHGHEATINLQTKEIVAKAIEQAVALKKFREILDQLEFPKTDDDPEGKRARQAWLDRIKAHPGGPEGYFAELRKRHTLILVQQVDSARQPTVPLSSDIATTGDPFVDPLLATITPAIAKVARTLHASDTAAVMLQAAIRHRLDQPDRAPADPWANAATDDAPATPFTFTPTPDGGFQLASRYQRNPDEPVTYKFAAPDAGVIRKK